MALTRTFSRGELEALGLPDELPRDRVLLRELWESRDWVIVNRLVFRSPDDEQIYEIFYDSPPTEMQEDVDPWNDDMTAEATMVEQRIVFRQEWRPIGSPKRKDEANLGIDEAVRQGLSCAVCRGDIEYTDTYDGQWTHLRQPADNHPAVSLIWGQDPAPWARRNAT